ncbi:MAG: hypothetical protein KC983_04505 [Phycisphaerales bacterium]|nr:hypothetical protein [Phycisphaerales bacterium]
MHKGCLVLSIVSALGAAPFAHASMLEFCFSGTFDNGTSFVVPDTATMVSAGDAFLFAFTFDTTAMNQEMTNGLGAYALVSSRFEVAGLQLAGDAGQINLDARADGTPDVFVAASTFANPMFVDVTVLFPDATFGDADLPTTLDLPSFPGATLGVSVLEGLFTGTVDTFEVKVVPGPSTIAVLGLGGMLGRRRRRRA